MTIELNPELEAIVEKQLATGLYHSAAEVLRDALSLLDRSHESADSRRQRLDEEIDRGLNSLDQGKGIDGELFFEELHQREERANPSGK